MIIGGNYTIDFAKISNIPKFTVGVKAGDSKRKISLTLLENNIPINLHNYNVVVACKKSDGNDIFNTVNKIDAINGKCEVEVSDQMLALDTDLPCEIVLYGVNGFVATSSNFVINRISSVRDEKGVVSSSEFTILIDALNRVRDIDNRINEIKEHCTGGNGMQEHSHVNKLVLDQLEESEGKLLFKGEKIDFDLKPNSVEYDNLNCFDRVEEGTLNLFSNRKLIEHFFIDGNGTINARENTCVTDYIQVEPNAMYTRTYISWEIAFYDKDYNFIQGSNNFTQNAFTVPNNSKIKYMRTNVTKAELEKFMIVKGPTIPSEYIEHKPVRGFLDYRIKIDSNNIDKDNKLDVECIDMIDEDLKGKIKPTGNLFDKNAITRDYYVKVTTGELVYQLNTHTSDYMPVKEETQYCKGKIGGFGVTFYDSNKSFISGFDIDHSGLFITPKGCSYVRITVQEHNLDREGVFLGTAFPTKIPEPERYPVINSNIQILGDAIRDNTIGIDKLSYDLVEKLSQVEPNIYGDDGNLYKIKVNTRGEVYAKHIVNEIPIVKITGDLTGISADNKVWAEFSYSSNVKNFNGKCKLEWQGHGSLNYPKKNYSIDLYDMYDNKMKVRFRDWKPQNEFHLKANFTDSSHLRNIVSAQLMFEAYKNPLPTVGRGVIDGFPILVYINDIPQGVYTWNLKQSAETYGLTKENPNHLMYRCEIHSNAGSFADTSNTASAWEQRFPKTNLSSDIDRLNRLINFVATSSNEDFKKNFNSYMNLEYAIDYWIYCVCFGASDSLGRNMNLVTYDGSVWYPTLYDMDTSMGIHYDGSNVSNNIAIPSQSQCPNSVLWKRLRENFPNEILNRYLELRNTLFNTEKILDRIKTFIDSIGDDNYKLDKELWPNIKSNGITYNYISQWITTRLYLIDNDLTMLTKGK